jgi:processive 1,2-diacylglycerol beta-glucosyltransferase
MKVVGCTSKTDCWMASAGLLAGKPGGLTSSEALARGLVLVIVNPIPGQEERKSDHFLQEGVEIRCNNLPALAYKIDTLLADHGRLSRMQEAAKRMARPDAASKVVATILQAKQVNASSLPSSN